MSAYYDYRLRFLAAGLATALQAFDWLRGQGLMGPDDVPDNQLGWTQGTDAGVDPETLAVIPAKGNPLFYYVHIRTRYVEPEQLAGLDLAQFGLELLDTPALVAEGEQVLGVWA